MRTQRRKGEGRKEAQKAQERRTENVVATGGTENGECPGDVHPPLVNTSGYHKPRVATENGDRCPHEMM